MMPRSSGMDYYHPNVYIDRPTKLVPFGWYSLFSDYRVASTFNLKRHMGAPMHLTRSIQSKFISTYLADPKFDLHSLRTPAALFGDNAWRDEDTSEYVRELYWPELVDQ